MNNTIGTFQCCVCRSVWDGSEILDDRGRATCGDAFCAANIFRLSRKAKKEYLEEAVPINCNVAYRLHHDYYVKLQKEGGLSAEGLVQYDLAMQREQQGLVGEIVLA